MDYDNNIYSEEEPDSNNYSSDIPKPSKNSVGESIVVIIVIVLIIGVVYYFTGYRDTNSYKLSQCNDLVINTHKPTILYGDSKTSEIVTKIQQTELQDCALKFPIK